MSRCVNYAATKYGYRVQVVGKEGVEYEYNGGNHYQDSTVVVDPETPGAVKLSKLKQYAKSQAREIAWERGIPKQFVWYDDDLEETLRNDYEERS